VPTELPKGSTDELNISDIMAMAVDDDEEETGLDMVKPVLQIDDDAALDAFLDDSERPEHLDD
jgi:hypothetical protein